MPGELPLNLSTLSSFDPSRRRFATAGLALIGSGWLAGCAASRPPPAGPLSEVPAFSTAVEGGPLPAGWRRLILRPDRVQTAYSIVRRDGRNVLHAVADSASSGLSVAVDIDARRTPWLRWEWRVDTVHLEASVADDLTEDTPARVVVAFGGDMEDLSLRDRMFYEQVELFTGNLLPYRTLTYVWDGQLSVGTVLPYARSKRIQYEVVETGAARAGRWLRYERNVLDDYRRVFGEPASGQITSVGVLTDSDDLKNHSEAWYGDIGLFASSAAGA